LGKERRKERNGRYREQRKEWTGKDEIMRRKGRGKGEGGKGREGSHC